jgi:putative nucleotide binding protein
VIIAGDEARFIEFFNKAGPISIRKHSLELLPSVGKKHMESILEERERKPFASFADLTKRVHLMPNPVRVIQERVLEELQDDNTKYYVFTAPPKREEPRRFR